MNEQDITQILYTLFGSVVLPDDPCYAQLPTYIEAQAAGEQAATLYPDVYDCIQRDSAFREMYEDLLEVIQLEAADMLPEPARTPVFDFSFLENMPPFENIAPDQSWLPERVLKAIRQWVSDLKTIPIVYAAQPAMAAGTFGSTANSKNAYRSSELNAQVTITTAFEPSDDSWEIQGYITRNDRPAEGVAVLLEPTKTGDSSDAGGFFALYDLPAGRYELLARFDDGILYIVDIDLT